jgi:hypothetical protein
MTTITVSIKLLSGDLLTLTIPEYMTTQVFYDYVYQQLSDEVAPEEDYMMTLLRVLDDEEIGELPADDDTLSPSDGEMFFVFMDTRKFQVELYGVWWETFDTREPTPRMFQQWQYNVYRIEYGRESMYYHDRFYYNKEEMIWLVKDNLSSEMVGRREDEEVISIPEDERMYSTMEEIAEVMIDRIPGLSRRAKTYIHGNLTWLWN